MEDNKHLIEDLKIALIYGSKPVDGVNKDGKVESIYKDEEDTAHLFYILDFLKDHLLDDENVRSAMDKREVNSIFYELQALGHIVFAENSSGSYKSGLFFMPQNISDKQKQSLDKFGTLLKKSDYNLYVFSKLHKDSDGVLTGNQLQGKSDVLNRFIYDIDRDR